MPSVKAKRATRCDVGGAAGTAAATGAIKHLASEIARGAGAEFRTDGEACTIAPAVRGRNGHAY